MTSVASSTASAQLSGRPDGMRFVPDVPGQWRALTERPEALGMHITTTPNPSACRHYQAMTRVDGPDGTPFFYMTRSGNTPEIPWLPNELACDDSPSETRNGHLIVFRMDSRNKNGERLRSNRLAKNTHVNSTLAPIEDRATIYFTIVGGDPAAPDPAARPGLVLRDGVGGLPPRVYGHPGGMQAVGHVLVMAMDTPRDFPSPFEHLYEEAATRSLVMFFDVRDPEDPIFISQYAPINGAGEVLSDADGIGLTPLPSGRYLMSITPGFEDKPVFFYRSTLANSEATPNVLMSPDLSWEFVGSTPGPDVDHAHQSLQFLREGDINGDLYLTGARGYAHPLYSDQDRIDLYKVACSHRDPDETLDPDWTPGNQITLTVRYNGRRITPYPNTGGDELADLAAATGFHVTPSGEILFYAALHDNDGPSGTVNAGEWRHIDIVRPDSPTYLPTAVLNGPYAVDEGSSVLLSGNASPPLTKAWIQLFGQLDYGGTDFSAYYPVVDYDDYDLDNFDNFFALELLFTGSPILFSHNDKARSWKWFAPVGGSIIAKDHVDHTHLSQGTVDESLTLVGDGFPHTDPNLTTVLTVSGDNIDQEIDAVDFLASCDLYYATPIRIEWDLDVDGSFESTGTHVTFNAAAFDGPSDVAIQARARHPAGGAPSQTQIAWVSVNNVAPALTPLRLTDSAGNEINVVTPFVLIGLPVTVGAGFTDPGLHDHQTASLAWGDGSIDTTFLLFDEAFGDGTGGLAHRHSYSLAGSHTIALEVTDDDGDADSETAVVRVLTPAQAVEEIIDSIEDLIAGTANKKLAKALDKAHKALAGSNPNSNNGALNKIRNGNKNAALTFLRQAIDALREAQAAGADVAVLIALLQQVSASLSAP